MPPPLPCPGLPFPLRRREFLSLGLRGLAGLSLPALYRLRSVAATEPAPQTEPTAVILVWLIGGVSHLETWDPKPSSGSEYRGPYDPIATRLPGVHFSELLPRQAALADRFSILRSLVHTGFCHQQGAQQLLTGHPVRELRNKPDDPDLFSIAHLLRSDPSRSLPNYVGVNPVPYIGSAYLGPAWEPFSVTGDPNDPKFEVPNLALRDPEMVRRLEGRIDLRRDFDRLRRIRDRAGTMDALDAYEAQAWNVLTSQQTKQAFDLSDEDDLTRDRYGRNQWGQQCLLARRLVEAGVELVTTTLNGPLCGRVQNWDDHAVNHNVFEIMKLRAPLFDQAVAALVEDLFSRGLDRRVLLIVTGEFGRTPKISYAASTGEGRGSASAGTMQPGRDHWPSATSLMFCGGGIPPGQVIGATDSRGEQVIERRVGVHDFLATVYRHLGIDAGRISFQNHSGRPIPILPEGRPIPELTPPGRGHA
ncbi:MAG: DUF1501 domain-containing protein [Planctomycetaceae bacterium]|jgi:hypothetical protein